MVAAPRVALADVHVERAGGAESCPDAASFAARLREGGAGAAVDTTGDITVRFERAPTGYRSSVTAADGRHRSLADDAPTCDGLAEATVLAVKLALELEPATASPIAVAPPAVAPPSPTPPPTAPADAPPAAQPPSSAAAIIEVSASGVVAFGLASPVASGARAGASLVLGHGYASVGVTGLVLPSQTRNIGDGAVDLSVLGGGVEGCGRVPVGASLLVALCGRVEGLSIDGTARGFKRSEDHARAELAGTLLGRARATLTGRLGLFLEAGAMVPFARERFSIDTVGVVYDPPVVAAATGIGVVVDFE